MSHTLQFACVPALLLFAGGAVQDPGSAPSTADPLVLQAGAHEVPTLIDRFADYLTVNILRDAEQTQGARPIELQHPLRVDRSDAFGTMQTLLYTRGLVILPVDAQQKMYECVSTHGPRRHEITTRTQLVDAETALTMSGMKAPITVQVELKNISSPVASNCLRPFFASSNNSTLQIGTTGSERTILLSGLSDQVAQAVRLLRQADNAAQPEFTQMQALVARVKKLEERVAALEGK